MKRFTTLVLVVITVFALTACSDKQQEDTAALQEEAVIQTQEPTPTTEVDEVSQQNKIGFCLTNSGSFTEQLKLDIETECGQLNYEAVIVTAETAEEQNTQIRDMISESVSVIVVMPVDVDELESILDECDSHDIPVINAVDSINGIVSTLITPDFLSIGKSAGRDAVELYGSSEAQCLMIKTSYDSFSMQLMTDGFMEEIGKDKDVTLVDEVYCGSDEEQAYEAAMDAVEGGVIDFIFAQSDVLAKGALRAIEETGSSVKLVAYGGDMELISAAVDGKVHSCIFFGTKSLAKEALYVADRFVKNSAYMPDQYIELRIEAAQGSDAPKYYVEGGLYAQTTAD